MLLFLLLTMVTHSYGQSKNSIEQLLEKEKIPGAVWTIVQGDSITTFSAGIKNLSNNEELKSDDRVHIGSITKTILALGILMLETREKANIDDPVKKYLPDLPVQNPWEATHPITIRHLLDHTSGLSDLRLWHFFSSGSNPDTPLSEFYTRNPDVLRVQVKPGEIFSYSNMGYTLLGMVIEQVTNQPYEKYLDANLLKPIGMHDSTFGFTSQAGDHKCERLAMGHFDNGAVAHAWPIYLRPAAQFTTTAIDMGILIQFMLNKGTTGDTPLISSSYFEKLGKPDYTAPARRGLQGGYAFGISLRDRHGVVGNAHSGNIIGYRAMMYLFPEDKKGFFISHNMDSETADYESFNKELIELLDIPKAFPEYREGVATKGLDGMQGYYVPAVTKIEPLTLLDIIGSFSRVELTEKGMILTPFQKKSVELLHIGDGIFRAQDRVYPSHVLYKEGNKTYLSTGIFTMYKYSGWYILLLFISLIAGLTGLVGVLVSGFYQVWKYKLHIVKQPIIYAFMAIVFLAGSMILIASKNIIYIGDKNPGSFSLYVASLLFPVLVIISLVAYLKSNELTFRSIGFWATLFLLQFSMVSFFYGLIPFSTWN